MGRPQLLAPAGTASHSPHLPTSATKGPADSGVNSPSRKISGLLDWLSSFIKLCTGTVGCWRMNGGWGTLSGGLCPLGRVKVSPSPLESRVLIQSADTRPKEGGDRPSREMTGPRSHNCSVVKLGPKSPPLIQPLLSTSSLALQVVEHS